ncbi:MAG TPA: hypothetical protein VHK91_00140 [Flavisolibacter sp.]|jgi:hypothetical protein|nr:hypothetical protein [Flavisolibacter sp.]
MKKRITGVLNFLAFNLLFFALYLNFIHKDAAATDNGIHKTATTSVQGTVLVSNPNQYVNKHEAKGTSNADAKTAFN